MFLPPARSVEVVDLEHGARSPLNKTDPEGVFEGRFEALPRQGYRLAVEWESGEMSEVEDPYRFRPELDQAAFDSFHAGTEARLHRRLGAHGAERDGVRGTRFAVWAPRAEAVNLMGSFNGWEARRSPMYPVGTGVWELFVPGVEPGALYKYEVRTGPEADALVIEKTDPMGRQMEVRPRTASVVAGDVDYPWGDSAWLESRAATPLDGTPVSVYEIHLGSWRRNEDGSWLGYRALADRLLPYAKDLGFTHVELLPITEHPYDGSWGYQTIGYFAPTSRYGPPADFKYFVDQAHQLGLGVILDWVPGHFPFDSNGLRAFDGLPLYEVEDEERAVHPDWGTLVFDYSRPEVVSFLVSSAMCWAEEYHVDGIRVDAVASMLYLDYSRDEGEWEPNAEGGRENLEAAAFLRRLTETVHDACPGFRFFAEESTTWPGITSPVDEDGLGFDYKWNMGWMNDSLRVMSVDPHRRSDFHERLTFSLHYAHEERYLLPLSHDEVVHLKRSLLSKMPGGYDAKFAGLRLLLGYMWTHPGAKLLFMGGELAQWAEWDEDAELDWDLLEHPPHAFVRTWVRALNEAYRNEPALHALDHETSGFEWIDVHDAKRSVLAYMRWEPEWEDFIAVVANFSSKPWSGYRLALPIGGEYSTVLDSDDPRFGGKGRAPSRVRARERPYLGRPASARLFLPPLSLRLLKRSDPGGAVTP